ncbi:SUN domain-containing protein 3-like [Calonectris borealis]|uniref:SUN domain-containing protein 3-like n=1 Tax=Calonectris borealis TaxID=1323832 RepID=UPI003F4B9B27
MLREEVLGSREESRLFPPPGQGAGVVEMPARLGRRRNTHQKGRSILRLLFLLLPVLSAVVYCSGSTIWGKGALREASQLPEAEPQSLGNSQAWLEQKKRELKETVAQVSAARGNILQAVREVLEAHGVQEEKREEVLRLTEAAVQKVLENYLQMPDWALEAIGAAIDEERTSKSYGGQGKMTWWPSPFGFSSANPPETILQPRIAPGNCWAFQGSRGHVVIRLPEQIWPRAFTIWHISEAVSPSGEVSSAPKDFAVSGVDEATAETLLGTFTYEVHKEIAQTFHVQKELPRTFRYIKFQVQSNWGNPEYTCMYRVQVHGKAASHNDHPQAQELL